MFSVIHAAFRGDAKSALHEKYLVDLFASIDANQLDELKNILISAPRNILTCPLDGQYAMHRAVQLNRVEILQFMLKDIKANSSVKSADGETVWHLAVKSKNTQLLDILFECSKPTSEVNKQKESVLDLVVKLENLELVKRFLQHGFRNVNFFDACANTKIFAELISNIKNLNIYSLNERGQSLMHAACRNKNIGLVRSLVMDGFDINQIDSDGRTPIHMAIKASDLNMVIFLYTNKAILKPAKKQLWASKKKFVPVILEAIDYSDPAIISYLIRNGADLNAQDPSGLNAISLAAKRGLADSILRELIAAGSDPTLADKTGRTALNFFKNDNGMTLFIYKTINVDAKEKGFIIPKVSTSHIEYDCPICKELINSSDPVYLTSCEHYYHQECLDFWLESSLNCPQCHDKILKPK